MWNLYILQRRKQIARLSNMRTYSRRGRAVPTPPCTLTPLEMGSAMDMSPPLISSTSTTTRRTARPAVCAEESAAVCIESPCIALDYSVNASTSRSLAIWVMLNMLSTLSAYALERVYFFYTAKPAQQGRVR